jgi:hypothetical protein
MRNIKNINGNPQNDPKPATLTLGESLEPIKTKR